MKWYLTAFLLAFILGLTGYFVYLSVNRNLTRPVVPKTEKEKPLEKYAFENLRNRTALPGPFEIGRTVKTGDGFESKIFYFYTAGKRSSGLINTPVKPGNYPVIVMLRGFVDISIYEIGVGTAHAGEVFAKNGFITLAPDFLGYGESASPSANSLEERFETYTTVLDLLVGLSGLNNVLQISGRDRGIVADPGKTGIWGHSNGGQIALSILEVTGKSYPTVLWAPVSKPFPYSILYFTDEFEDHGKALRRVVAEFEKDYDIERYSPSNYYDWIKAPIQLHQGTGDEAVPFKWSDNLYADLKKLDKEISYYKYPGADHNLSPEGWGLAVGRSIDFFRKYL